MLLTTRLEHEQLQVISCMSSKREHWGIQSCTVHFGEASWKPKSHWQFLHSNHFSDFEWKEDSESQMWWLFIYAEWRKLNQLVMVMVLPFCNLLISSPLQVMGSICYCKLLQMLCKKDGPRQWVYVEIYIWYENTHWQWIWIYLVAISKYIDKKSAWFNFPFSYEAA